MTALEMAIERMTARLRNYGDKKPTAFVSDCMMLLGAAKDCKAGRAEIEQLRACLIECFSLDPSMAAEGCDIIGHNLLAMSKESRLTIINTIRAAAAAKEEK